MSEIDRVSLEEGVLDRGLGAWGRLAPLSAGAVATGLLAVGVGRILGLLVGRGVRRSVGWSAVGALIPLALWLMSGSDGGRAKSGDAADEKVTDTGGMESVDG
jgi:hypothetical protein